MPELVFTIAFMFGIPVCLYLLYGLLIVMAGWLADRIGYY